MTHHHVVSTKNFPLPNRGALQSTNGRILLCVSKWKCVLKLAVVSPPAFTRCEYPEQLFRYSPTPRRDTCSTHDDSWCSKWSSPNLEQGEVTNICTYDSSEKRIFSYPPKYLYIFNANLMSVGEGTNVPMASFEYALEVRGDERRSRVPRTESAIFVRGGRRWLEKSARNSRTRNDLGHKLYESNSDVVATNDRAVVVIPSNILLILVSFERSLKRRLVAPKKKKSKK